MLRSVLLAGALLVAAPDRTVDAVNDFRRDNGVGTVAFDDDISQGACAWARTAAETGRERPDPDLNSQLGDGWIRGSEVVVVAKNVERAWADIAADSHLSSVVADPNISRIGACTVTGDAGTAVVVRTALDGGSIPGSVEKLPTERFEEQEIAVGVLLAGSGVVVAVVTLAMTYRRRR
jgi:hypothetical protein